MAAERPTSGRRLPVGLMVVGSEMAGFTVVGVILDFALGTLPWITIGLTLLGAVIAFYHLVKMANAMANRPGSSDGENSR